jgi:hypothetical protein
MREGFDLDPASGLRIFRLPEDSPVITLEHVKAVQEALDEEDAARAFCTGS